jgi:uncharacterized protein YggE
VKHAPLAILLLLASSAASAQPAQAPPVSTVVVSGEGVVHAVPDRAWIRIGAESRASTPREAQRLNTEAMRPVQEKLKAAGVAADAVRTIGYDVQYEWDFVNNKRVGRGYVARNTIEVRVDAIERVGEYLELAVGSGATSLGGVRFDMKDEARLEREAMRLAVTDARFKAEAAAESAGRAIDRIVRIEEQGAAPPIPVQVRTLAAQGAADSTPPIAVGQVEIRARVTLTVALK